MKGQPWVRRFREVFGHDEGIRIFFAPGRVNLIGEHTDYNGGYVFPAALTFGIWALVAPRNDGMFRFRSTGFDRKVDIRIGEIVFDQEDDWANYPKGMLHALLHKYAPFLASRLQGADMLFHGNIPNGAGLSSSASIMLVTAIALTKLAQMEIPMIELVKLAQQAENEFIGVNCGILDPFAIGMGRKNHAIKLKCDTLEYEYFPVRIDGYKLVITHTNKRRSLADSKYNERRRECEEGLRLIRQKMPEIRSLGDLSVESWRQIAHVIQDEVIRKRVEHVVSENERVLLATRSLRENDLERFGHWMKQSHQSLRDLYEVTGKELDALFEAACNTEGCIGTRMTGAGFGGCSISLVKEEQVKHFKKAVSEAYMEKTGLLPSFYVCEIGGGPREMTEEACPWPSW